MRTRKPKKKKKKRKKNEFFIPFFFPLFLSSSSFLLFLSFSPLRGRKRPWWCKPLVTTCFISFCCAFRPPRAGGRTTTQRGTNAHQHAYCCCRLRLSAQQERYAQEKANSSYNANDDTTFTSNCLLILLFPLSFLSLPLSLERERERERKEEQRKKSKRTYSHPVRLHILRVHEIAHCSRSENIKKEKETASAIHSLFFDLYHCGLCLKRSHTVLDIIHTAASGVQHLFRCKTWTVLQCVARCIFFFFFPSSSHSVRL